MVLNLLLRFLSTLSLRRATNILRNFLNGRFNFYPRSPCGERLNGLRHKCASFYFYPRSPCGERRAPRITPTASRNFYPRSPCGERLLCLFPCRSFLLFLSTLSLRRATVHYDNYNLHCVISIHALLAESDIIMGGPGMTILPFLSTLSLRRATVGKQQWESLR